jgi:hypothetical protein
MNVYIKCTEQCISRYSSVQEQIIQSLRPVQRGKDVALNMNHASEREEEHEFQ